MLPNLHKAISAPPRPFRCQGCDNAKPRLQRHKVPPPRLYTFNRDVGVDVFEIVDSVGTRFSILNAVCMGTTYDQAWVVRESENLGSPSSHACLTSFRTWLDALGWLALRLFDAIRGTHNRGVFGSTFAKNGVVIRPVGLEAPELSRKSTMTRCHAQEDDVESHSRTRTLQAENQWT